MSPRTPAGQRRLSSPPTRRGSAHAGPVGVIAVSLLTLAVCMAVVMSRSTHLHTTAQITDTQGPATTITTDPTISATLLADAIRPTAHPSVAADAACDAAAAAAAQVQEAAAAAEQATATHAAQARAAAQAMACATDAAGSKHVLVSIATQTLWACSGTQLVNMSRVTTGRDGSTPTGTFHVQAKEGAQYLNGCDSMGCWHDYVHVWIPFLNGVYGFHDAPWQTMPFGNAGYTTQGSHGCVHLPAAEAAWVDTWIAVGTSVTIEA